MEDLQAELKVWKKWVFNNLPIENLNVKVLCTYAEVFGVPFKFDSAKMASYQNPIRFLYLRDEYLADAKLLQDQGIVDIFYDAVGQFPEKFQFFSKAVYLGRNKHEANLPDRFKNLAIGACTGNYYIDLYGYCWFELYSNYLPTLNAKTWVRETALTYDGKDEMQNLIDENRTLIMQMRAGSEDKKTKSKTWLTILSLGSYLFTR